MPAGEPYIDTSVLAKRYLNEPGSAEFERYLGRRKFVLISRLTLVEMHCLMSRHERNGDITSAYAERARADLAEDVGLGYFRLEPFGEAALVLALQLIARLRKVTLRTLDALHLAFASNAGAEVLVTADRRMASAGRELGFRIRTFGIDDLS